jgi:hypothetical protein
MTESSGLLEIKAQVVIYDRRSFRTFPLAWQFDQCRAGVEWVIHDQLTIG